MHNSTLILLHMIATLYLKGHRASHTEHPQNPTERPTSYCLHHSYCNACYHSCCQSWSMGPGTILAP